MLINFLYVNFNVNYNIRSMRLKRIILVFVSAVIFVFYHAFTLCKASLFYDRFPCSLQLVNYSILHVRLLENYSFILVCGTPPKLAPFKFHRSVAVVSCVFQVYQSKSIPWCQRGPNLQWINSFLHLQHFCDLRAVFASVGNLEVELRCFV